MNIFAVLLIWILSALAPVFSTPAFEVVALGVGGGPDEGNLSSWLVKPVTSKNYVSLDSGTLVNGLFKAFNQTANTVLTAQIPSYLISHAHFDHYLGLLVAQPALKNNQTILAQEATMNALLSHVFTWAVWGNFGDDGDTPRLGFLHYQTLPLGDWQPIPGTDMTVKAFPLSHGNGFPSSAFLIQYNNEYILYFGDTGADLIEKSQAMQTIWTDVAPLVRQKQLHAILLECSYTDAQPVGQLFGHLTPTLFMEEMHHLATAVDDKRTKEALKDLTVFVTHIKSDASSLGAPTTADTIMAALRKKNDLGVRLVLPEQGKHYAL